jgi:iron complex transport system substrate-binding protein
MRRYALPLIIMLGVVALFCWLLGTRKAPAVAMLHPDATTFPMTVTDERGKQVTLAQRPLRIVSLAPSVTEMLFAVGAGPRLIADTTYCNYPAAAALLPKVGGYIDPNIEKIVADKPDLVFGAKGNAIEALDRLPQCGIPVITVDPATLEDVEGAIRLIGRATGNAPAGERLATRCAQRRAAVARRIDTLAASARPRTLLLFSPDSLFSAGPGSHLDEMIRLAGGVNVAARAKIPWPELSMESVISANPEIIIFLSGHATKTVLTVDAALTRLRADRRWRALSAVQHGRVVVLDNDVLTLPGPRLIDGLETMAAAIHPALFAGETRR